MFALLSRSYGEKQTTGCLSIYDEDTEVYQCRTLELPYLENHKDISCIPPGEYKCERITSVKFGLCFIVKDVPGRSGILFHSGNFTTDTEGCILPGLRFVDINLDGNIDVADSLKALGMMLHILPSKFSLLIR
jgi:hypothetical protein